MNGFLDRKRILELFDELSKELRLEGARAQIYIIGGAAMSLAFSRDRRTEDVDARIDVRHGRVRRPVEPPKPLAAERASHVCHFILRFRLSAVQLQRSASGEPFLGVT